jgi:glycosyltransferase involved in cell wall biosynthesis
MKVLWLTPDKPDDISVGRQRLAAHLRERDIRVTLRGTTLRTILRTIRDRGDYDVLVGTTRAGALAGSILHNYLDCPLVVDHVDPIAQFATTHSRLSALLVRCLENIAFRMSSHTLYVYEEERDRVCGRTKCTKTTLGVEYDRFATPTPDILSDVRVTLSEYELAKHVAVYVGGLEPLYNIEQMLGSIDHLSDWSLLVLGTGSLEGFVRQRAENDPSVVFLDTVPHETVPGYLHEADVGLSLVDDPHTLKVLEYGAAGLPSVVLSGQARSRFGALVTYSRADPQAIADNISRAAEGTDGVAFQQYVSQFGWESVAYDYERVLREVAD